MSRAHIAPLILFALAACHDTGLHLTTGPKQVTNWHRSITDNDRIRERNWRASFAKALMAAQLKNASDVNREGLLLQPDAELDHVDIPAGLYHCRTIKLGAQPPRTVNFEALAPQQCSIRHEGALLRYDQLTGVQRPYGLIYTDRIDRQIFLGTLRLGDESLAQFYNRDTTRDMVGLVERLGPDHWRILLPAPHFESVMDVVDLTPIALDK